VVQNSDSVEEFPPLKKAAKKHDSSTSVRCVTYKDVGIEFCGEFFRPGRPARPGFSVDAVPAVPASNFFTEIEPSINGGGREEPTQRLFVVYRTTTITTTTGTSYSTLTTYRTCYSKAPAAITDCKSSTLTSGKRKRRELSSVITDEVPMAAINAKTGETLDLVKIISASRVRREADAVSEKRSGSRTSKSKTVLETLQEVNVSGLEKLGICNGQKQNENSAPVNGRGEDSHHHHYNVQGRALLTFHQTSTTSVEATSTSTVVPDEIETILFTTADAAQCFPSQLVSSIGIPACS